MSRNWITVLLIFCGFGWIVQYTLNWRYILGYSGSIPKERPENTLNHGQIKKITHTCNPNNLYVGIRTFGHDGFNVY